MYDMDGQFSTITAPLTVNASEKSRIQIIKNTARANDNELLN